MKLHNYIVTFIVLATLSIAAQPDVSTKQAIDSVVIYQDHEIESTYYYVPYGLKLVKNEDGKPDFKFLQMRYTGTRTTNDEDVRAYRSLLRFKVSNHSASTKKLNDILETLRSKGAKILKPIPINNLNVSLIHTATPVAGDTLPNKFDSGFLENADGQSLGKMWKQRDFILRLDNHDAQQFADAFEKQHTILSVNYSYSANVVDTSANEVSTTGRGSLSEAFEDISTAKDSSQVLLKDIIVNSGAISIEIDVQKWPDLMKKVDINERVPADYPLVDIYCFDFNNQIRSDLYAKKVEIKAMGVSGQEVVFSNMFRATEPEIYASRMKFVNAVKLSEPYEFRITEIYHDGEYKKFDWQQSSTWHEILDITTQTEEQ